MSNNVLPITFSCRLTELNIADPYLAQISSTYDIVNSPQEWRSPVVPKVLPSVTATVAAKTPLIDEEKNDIMRAGLLSKVFDHITLLVEDGFVSVWRRMSVIPCPFCSEDISHMAKFKRSFSGNSLLQEQIEEGGLTIKQERHRHNYRYAFNHDDCIVTACNQDTMQCPTHGDIPLHLIAPDIVS